MVEQETEKSANRRNLIGRLAASGQWDRVLETARDWLSEDPENAMAHRYAAQALINLDRHGEADVHLGKVLAARPTDGFAHRMTSIVHFNRKRYGEADKAVRRAIDINPQDPNNWYHLAWMCYTQRDLESALKWITKARELDPNNADFLNLFALCSTRNSDASGARATLLKQVLELDPENANAHNNLGSYYLNTGKDYAEAEACFRRALTIEPTMKMARSNLFVALKHRDWIYRVLCAPRDALLKVINAFGGRKGAAGLLVGGVIWIVAFRFVLGGLVLWAAFFWPMLKVYEFLTIGDMRNRAGEVGARRGGILNYRRWSLKVRLSLFAALLVIFWSGIGWMGYRTYVADAGDDQNLTTAFGVVVSVVMLVLLFLFGRKTWRNLFNRYHNWRRKKRLKTLDTLHDEKS